MGTSCKVGRSVHVYVALQKLQAQLHVLFVVGLLFVVDHPAVAHDQKGPSVGAADLCRTDSKLRVTVDAVHAKFGKGALDKAQTTQAKLTYSLADGDSVTCIPIGHQRSLKDPIVPLQLRPSRFPKVKREKSGVSSNPRGATVATQLFSVEAGSCPEGTIPVRKSRDLYNLTSPAYASHGTESHEISKLQSHGHYRGIKKSFPPSFTTQRQSSQPLESNNYTDDIWVSPHEHAFVVVNDSRTFKGAKVILNLWSPYVENKHEFSLAQLWMISGSYWGNTSYTILNTIEAGWQVFEGLYGDNLPRLFIFWTADAYNVTGCYNLYCSGFVQVSNKVVVGGSFTPSSKFNSTQYEIDLFVFKDKVSGNWWLQLNGEPVGYWPSEIFTGQLRKSASYIEFGGEIIDDEEADGYRHTKTQMGSGLHPSAGHKFAAYQRNIQVIDKHHELRDARLYLGKPEAPYCYNAILGSNYTDWGSHFYFGGKGYSSICRHNIKARP